MGSSTVELSLDPIVLQKQTFTTRKNTPHVYFFNLSLFLLFFPTICSFLFLTARLRFVQTPTPSGQHWNVLFKKKLPAHTKKNGSSCFFNPNFFSVFPFFTKEQRGKMKKIVRERRYPERFSPFFCISSYGGEMAFYMFLETPNLL